MVLLSTQHCQPASSGDFRDLSAWDATTKAKTSAEDVEGTEKAAEHSTAGATVTAATLGDTDATLETVATGAANAGKFVTITFGTAEGGAVIDASDHGILKVTAGTANILQSTSLKTLDVDGAGTIKFIGAATLTAGTLYVAAANTEYTVGASEKSGVLVVNALKVNGTDATAETATLGAMTVKTGAETTLELQNNADVAADISKLVNRVGED